MLYLKWTFVLLSILHIIISIKGSETETEGHSDVAPLSLDDCVKAVEPDKKKLGDSITEKESKTVVEIKNKSLIEKDIYEYISLDRKHAYARIQAVIEGLDDMIRILHTYAMPDLTFTNEDYYKYDTIFKELLKKLSLPFGRFVNTIIDELERAIDKVKKGDAQAYAIARDQFLNYCKTLQSELRELLLKVPMDNFTDSEIILIRNELIDKNILENPKIVIEKLYAGMVIAHVKHGNILFGTQKRSFDAIQYSLVQARKTILMTSLWEISTDDYEALLYRHWNKQPIDSPFGFILDILIDSLSKMLDLSISIVKCVEIFLSYIRQIEDMYWRLYASRIHAFDLHYVKPKEIAKFAVSFTQLRTDKLKAKTVVNQFVIYLPNFIVDLAFSYSSGGFVTKKTRESLEESATMLYTLLCKRYEDILERCYITAIYTRFLDPLVKDLLCLEKQGIKVNSDALLEALKTSFQNISNMIYDDLEKSI